MTNDELKRHLMTGRPVTVKRYDGTVGGACVSAIIYRRNGNGIKVSAEVKSYGANSVVIVDPEALSPWRPEQ